MITPSLSFSWFQSSCKPLPLKMCNYRLMCQLLQWVLLPVCLLLSQVVVGIELNQNMSEQPVQKTGSTTVIMTTSRVFSFIFYSSLLLFPSFLFILLLISLSCQDDNYDCVTSYFTTTYNHRHSDSKALFSFLCNNYIYNTYMASRQHIHCLRDNKDEEDGMHGKWGFKTFFCV